jgi:A/G-specific adenine glycosylase
VDFSKNIIRWYNTHKRDLPWRETSDPYLVWLSEVILQQTRVEQGLPYFHRFVDAFPTVDELAAASEDEVLKHWQGLGYYSRARNLHHAAKEISSRWKGKFPSDYKDILSLKGIGTYTAAAIASFSFNLPHPVIDGNVYRLLSRYFGISSPIDSTNGRKEFSELAHRLIDLEQPAIYNQAIMEFGSLQCKPSSPDCGSCPLMHSCVAFKKGLTGSLPVKSKKMKPSDRYFNYLVILDSENILLNRRVKQDIWKNMYDFPLVESSSELNTTQLLQQDGFRDIFTADSFSFEGQPVRLKHQLTHQTIHASFFRMQSRHHDISITDSMVQEDVSRLSSYAVPRLIEKYLNFLVT